MALPLMTAVGLPCAPATVAARPIRRAVSSLARHLFGSVTLALLVAIGSAQGQSLAAKDLGGAGLAALAGVWMLEDGGAEFGLAAEALMTPWGLAQFAEHRATIGPRAGLDANDPTLACLPPGIPYILMIPTPFEFIATGPELLQIFEYDHSLRRIHLDGRAAPAGLLEDGMYQWMGYSSGHQEDDDLVVESRGFNESGWLDRYGHPRSGALVVTERLRLLDEHTLVVTIEINDSKAYTRPWSGQLTFRRRPDWEIFEHVCLTERDVSADYLEFKERAWQEAP